MIKNLLCIAMISLIGLSACDRVVSKTISKTGQEIAEEAAERSVKEVSKRALKAGAKEIAEEGAEKALTKTLKELATSDKTCKFFYESFNNSISKEFADGVAIKSTKNGMEMISKDFPKSAIKIQNNTIIGKAGSLVTDGHMNEFLNYLIPNKTYIVDDALIYKTDKLGRVVTCSADRTKAFNKLAGKRNPQRNTDVQKMIVDKLGGNAGDDGGHLFANATGGPNELINQVPMAKSLNRNGQWRELERLEEEALRAGKQVVSQRNLLYHGDEMRPYAIEFVCKIDGAETRVLVQNVD